MNKKQSVVIGVATVAVAVSGLAPPWQGRYGQAGPYSLLWRHPEYYNQIDITRLGIEWVIVAVVTAALYAFFGRNKEK